MQKHLDNTTKTPNGQGSGGPDKSKATPVLYTQMGTASTLDSFLATLVADARAELGLPPTPTPTPSLDSIMAATVARARAELAADAREIERGNAIGLDLDFVQRIGFADESAIERAYRTGIIGADVESTVGVRNTPTPYPYRQPDIAGDGDTFDAMPRSGIYECLYPGRDKAKVVLSVRGGSFRIDLACEDSEGDCPPCRQHWIDSAARRLRHGLIGNTQLVITATGCQTPEAAQTIVTAIGRQLGPVRRCQVLSRSPDYTYGGHIVVTGAMPLPATLEAIAARPGVSAEYRAVSDSDFKALLHSRSKMDGKRCPVRFLHWPKAVKADAATTTYAHNDGYVAAAMDVRKIPAMVYGHRQSLKIPESQRVRIRENEAATNAAIWLTGVDLDLAGLLELRNARREGIRDKNDWQTCIVAGTYDGPKSLIRHLAAALDDSGMVSFTARKAMRRAAIHIREGI